MDIFGTKKRFQEIKERREKQEKLRDLAFETVKNSSDFYYKIIGKKGSKEYWEWRLDFDCKRFGINLK